MLRPPVAALSSLRAEVSAVVSAAVQGQQWKAWLWIAGVVVFSLVLIALLVYFSRQQALERGEKDPDLVKSIAAAAGPRAHDGMRRMSTYHKVQEHGLLQGNVDAEHLEQGSTHMYEYSKMGMSARHQKMLFYDIDKTTGWDAFFNLSHTCLSDVLLWRTISVYIVVALVIAIGVATFQQGGIVSVNQSDSVRQLEDATIYLSALLAFMLSLFVAEIISRWWRCRMECVEALWAALQDMQLFLAIRCPEEKDSEFKETILRLCLLCHRLMYAETRQHEGTQHLQSLVNVELMTEEELELLDGQHAKAQLVLVWIGRMYTAMGEKREWGTDVVLHLDENVRRARNALGKVFSYCGTQLPYQYVHLLSYCTLLCNLLLSMKCGIMIGQSLSAPDPYVFTATMQLFQVVAQPFAYHAFLRLCSELSNPFGHDFSDFPGYAYHVYMRSEGFALQKAGQNVPKALMKITA